MKIFALALGFFCLLAATSCKKHTVSPPSGPSSGTLILRPDSTTGQDTYVAKIDVSSSDGNTNLNSVHELAMGRWTLSWYYYDSATWRGFIRFDSIAKIAKTATVSSATLYLYGESSSQTMPNGNSYYPGSTNPPNPSLIQQVTGGTWDQKTLTWNNAPATTTAGQDTIPASTSAFNYNAAVDVTNLVKQMVASPSTNYGFCIRLATENCYRAMEFSTCEAADSTLRPKLVVNWHN